MFIAFHTDPIDLHTLDSDLRRYGFAHLDTLRTNARRIEHALNSNRADVLGLAVRGPDGDYHHYLMSSSVAAYEGSATNDRVLRAILAWHAEGCPLPNVRAL